jgi:hypothetical protein
MADKPGKDDVNPYAAPDVRLGGAPPSTDAEMARAERIRRQFLNHEASVKAVGSLNLLGAIVLGVVMVAGIVSLFSGGVAASAPARAFSIGMIVVLAAIAALSAAVGIGLRNLQPWARWVDVGLILLGFAMTILSLVIAGLAGGNAAGTAGANLAQQIIPAYILYLLVSRKGTMVFSPEYRAIIEKTPHIRYKMSCLVKFLALFLLAVIGLALIGGLASYLSMKR